MKKITKGNLMFIKLEPRDWQGDGYGFCKEIKKLDGVQFNPPEMDEDNWWVIPMKHKVQFGILYYNHIGKVLATMDADKQAGFEPIPRRASGRFAHRRIV